MKKIITAFTLTAMFLFGCSFGSGPAEPVPREPEEIQPVETALDDNLFIALSAEILCLPSNHPEAAPEEIEVFAKNILENVNVSNAAFNIYQLKIEADATSKEELSLAILGKMGEFCTIVEEENSEIFELEEIVEISEEETEIVENSGEKICVVSGCNGEICAEENFDSVCIAKKEYQCYKSATCEVQEDGECGWTQSLELIDCLAEMRN